MKIILWRRFVVRSLAFLGLGSAFLSLQGEVALPTVFGDHMVLQREMAAPVWGTGTAGETITVQFAGQTKNSTVNSEGTWQVRLDPLVASAEPRELSVSSPGATLKIQDVLVGDVWLASGQSNMAYPLRALSKAADYLAQANDPLLRFFTVVKNTSAEPLTDLKGRWDVSTSESAKDFSAVAFFYAQEIRRSQNIPVAILHSSWGGTPIQTWIGLTGYKSDPPLTKPLEQWEKAMEQYQKVKADPKLLTNYQEELKKWKLEVEPAYNELLKAYNADLAAGKTQGPRPQPSLPEPANPDPIAPYGPSKRPTTPTVIFNAMIAPLTPYGLKGILWYQGETNGSSGLEYRELLPRLIQNWRGLWNQGELPFLIVQLPGCYKDETPVAKTGWPYLREAQFMALKLPKTGLAVTIDIGNPQDVHPDNKEFVGKRLALIGRKVAYDESIVYTGPIYQDSVIEGNQVKIRFREIGGGLTPGQAPWCAKGVEPMPTEKLIGFYIAGEDKRWVEAEAKVEGGMVIVSSPQVAKPVAVRYAWANSPRANLYNKEGLPAAPFRTDDWP
ncbi:MAG: sialate O-acetylesterase [Verrucomicrobiota bacterium]